MLVSTLADMLYTQVLDSNKQIQAYLKSQQRLAYALEKQQIDNSNNNKGVLSTANPTTTTTTATATTTTQSVDTPPAAGTGVVVSPPSFTFSGKEISMTISGLQSMSTNDGPEISFLLGLFAG